MLKGELDDENEDISHESRDEIIRGKLDARQIAIEDMLRNVQGAVYEAIVFVSNSMCNKPGMRHPLLTDCPEKTDLGSISQLLDVTATGFDNDEVRGHLISAQKHSLDMKIGAAVDEAMRIYTHAIRTAVAMSWMPLAGTITKAVTGNVMIKYIFNLFSFTHLYNGIIKTLEDKVWSDIQSVFSSMPAEAWSVLNVFSGGSLTYKITKDHVHLVATYNLTIAVDLILIFCYAVQEAAEAGASAVAGSEFTDVDHKTLQKAIERHEKTRVEIHDKIAKLTQRGTGGKAQIRNAFQTSKICGHIVKLIRDPKHFPCTDAESMSPAGSHFVRRELIYLDSVRDLRIKKRRISVLSPLASPLAASVQQPRPAGKQATKLTKRKPDTHVTAHKTPAITETPVRADMPPPSTKTSLAKKLHGFIVPKKHATHRKTSQDQNGTLSTIDQAVGVVNDAGGAVTSVTSAIASMEGLGVASSAAAPVATSSTKPSATKHATRAGSDPVQSSTSGMAAAPSTYSSTTTSNPNATQTGNDQSMGDTGSDLDVAVEAIGYGQAIDSGADDDCVDRDGDVGVKERTSDVDGESENEDEDDDDDNDDDDEEEDDDDDDDDVDNSS